MLIDSLVEGPFLHQFGGNDYFFGDRGIPFRIALRRTGWGLVHEDHPVGFDDIPDQGLTETWIFAGIPPLRKEDIDIFVPEAEGLICFPVAHKRVADMKEGPALNGEQDFEVLYVAVPIDTLTGCGIGLKI